MIRTTSDNQHEILRAILTLHCPDGFDADFTYSRGYFYRDGIPQPRLKFDAAPCREGVVQADVCRLPLERRSVKSAVFDPPFMHAHGKDSKIGNRFSSYPSQKHLHQMYHDAIREIYRVLECGGVFVFKCQDTVESGKQVMSHCLVWQSATDAGFEVLDLFVLLARNRMRGFNHGRQVHARKFHAYFWVFRKPVERSRRRLAATRVEVAS